MNTNEIQYDGKMRCILEVYGLAVPFKQIPILSKQTRNYSISCVHCGIKKYRNQVEPHACKHFSD